MPSSPQDSIDSPTPSGTPSAEGQPAPASPARPAAWRLHVALFLATVASAFVTSFGQGRTLREELLHAAQYTAALMAILLCHEFGHYVAARLHKVDASLPFFIPMPFISPFGTMGAVIRMRDPIRTRRALLDIGAAGPLAGLVVAVPLYAWGVAHSQLVALDGSSYGVELGDSLLLRTLDHLFGPAVPRRHGRAPLSRGLRRMGGDVRHDDQPAPRRAARRRSRRLRALRAAQTASGDGCTARRWCSSSSAS